MSGLELFDGNSKMRITYGSRTVLTTDGTLINLLPPSMDISQTFDVIFPDFSNKDYVYNWRHVYSYNSLSTPPKVGYNCGCATALTIPPQEWSDESNIIAAPPGSDIFVGQLVLVRTAGPTSTWNAEAINPLQPMGVVIPFISGSLMMEAKYGMARACSIYVAGGYLKLHRQQSVSTIPGGWGYYGDPDFNWVSPSSGSGGENVYGSNRGIPVLQIDSRNNAPYQTNADIFADPYDARSRIGGPNACATSISSNYSSTYSATLTGAFGRRS